MRHLQFLLCTALLAVTATGCPPPVDVPDGSTDGGRDSALDGNTLDGDTLDGNTNPDGNTPDGTTPDGNTPDGNNPDGGNNTGTVRITTCPGDALPAPATGTCSVTAGNAALLITGDVLTPGEVFRGGQVLVGTDGKIACVGCDCSAQAGAVEATKVVCPDGVISPGLINPHEHLTFANGAPSPAGSERYEHRHDWRRGRRGHTSIRLKGTAPSASVAWGELRLIVGGATSVSGSGGIVGFARNVDDRNMEGLGQEIVNNVTFPLGDSAGELIATGCGYPRVPTTTAIAGNDAYVPHMAEGIDVEARNEFLCTRAGANDVIQQQTALIHGVALLPPDIAEMATDGAGLIWSPRSNISLYGDTARVTEYARLGVQIAIGSDWIYSGSMNMLRELQCADTLNKNFFGNYFTDEQLWLMATRDAAGLLAVDDAVGVLATGRFADIAIFNASTRRDHRAVLDAEPKDIALVLHGGTVMYGDADLVAALPTGDACETLDVCTVNKRVCVSREFPGQTLASLTAANNNLTLASGYPLFNCGAPMNEPSCLPARTRTMAPLASVNGSTVYTGMSSAEDMDGDGIANAMDNCPMVFNPVRPVDNGRQGDTDGDGTGDSCDVCPLNANTTMCTAPDPNDSDADGVPNATDNCPSNANMDQADADMDGKGDVCDMCPMAANPGAQMCPGVMVTIPTLRNPAAPGHPALESNVTVTGGVVTWVNNLSATSRAFFMQDPTATSWAGVYVFVGAADVSMLQPGQMVTVSGRYTVFNGIEQVNATMGTFTPGAMGTVIQPLVVTPAEMATGGTRAAELQSMLLRVNMVTAATASTHTGAMPTSTGTWDFRVDGNLIVTNFLINGSTPATTPSGIPATMGQTFSSITGLGYVFRMDAKLAPRTPADLVSP